MPLSALSGAELRGLQWSLGSRTGSRVASGCRRRRPVVAPSGQRGALGGPRVPEAIELRPW